VVARGSWPLATTAQQAAASDAERELQRACPHRPGRVRSPGAAGDLALGQAVDTSENPSGGYPIVLLVQGRMTLTDDSTQAADP
jgi:hypothetical protein